MTEAPLRLGTRGSALALAQAKLVAKALGGSEIVPIKTSDDAPRGTRRVSSRRSSGRSWTARSISESTRPRICRRSCPRASRSRACPRGRIRATPTSGRSTLSESARRARGSVLPAFAVAPRSWRCAPTSRWSRSGATSTHGWTSSRRASTTVWCSPRPGCNGSAAPRRCPSRSSSTSWSRLRGKAPWCSRLSTPRIGQSPPPSRSPIGAHWGCSPPSEPWWLALDASCNTPLGALATLEPGGRMRIRAFCGLPDGSEWLRDELEEDASDPAASGGRWRSG